MIVECGTIDEFCTELQLERSNLLDNTVRVRVDKTPEQAECISFQVDFHATAIVLRSSAEWLLRFSGTTGCDEGDDTTGTDTADEWKTKIAQVLENTPVSMRHGKIEV